MPTDATHDPCARSWVPSARRAGSGWRGGVAIGDEVLDLRAAIDTGALGTADEVARAALQAAACGTLNDLMSLGRASWRRLRRLLFDALREGSAAQGRLADCLVPQAQVTMGLPATVGDYTDFFTSRDHMLRMGRLFQPDRPQLPQFTSLPIAYHGRASTVQASPVEVLRPWGQVRGAGGHAQLLPTRALDFELELGAWVGPGNEHGSPIGIDEADDHLFGVCLLNDWSARDVQGWEAVPLGPFQSKNFMTTVSPWIVTWEALAPFRAPVRRDPDDPPVLPYLHPPAGAPLALDLRLQAWLELPGAAPLCVTDMRSTQGHWSFAQMLAHHTLNGCALRPSDLLGSGTQSGPSPRECGCLMELTAGGQEPLRLPDGRQRTLLEDGDSVVLRGFGERPGAARIGLGECRGRVLAARGT